MKHIIFLLMILCLGIILSACCTLYPFQPPTPPPNEQPPTPPPVVPPTEPPVPEEGVSCEQAQTTVRELPEVQEYLGYVPKARIDCDSQEDDGTWLIHVYEIVEDAGVPHTATMDWYYVYPDGEVQSLFPLEDVME